MTKRDIEFLFEIGSLHNMQRGWQQLLGMDCASVSEHIFRVTWLALIIARTEGKVDENKIIKMAMVHDLQETRLSDLGYMQKVYVGADEDLATADLLKGTSVNYFLDIYHEYMKRDSLEAKIVKDADNLDVDLELKELDERGSKMPAKEAPTRRLIRDQKLYTKTAKKIWDAIQETDVSSWHLLSNKFYKIPEAGT
jgi:putative hydrolase of HD superfamily